MLNTPQLVALLSILKEHLLMSDIRNDVTKQNGGDSVGTLYRRSMDRLMIRDVQRKEIRRNLW